MNHHEHGQIVAKSDGGIACLILIIGCIHNQNERIEKHFACLLKTRTMLQQVRLIQVPLEELTLIPISSVHNQNIYNVYIISATKIYANKNSFVRSSLIRSRNLAAFSNSNFRAASRISDSILPMYASSSCCDLNSGTPSASSVRSA